MKKLIVAFRTRLKSNLDLERNQDKKCKNKTQQVINEYEYNSNVKEYLFFMMNK
jgi:hypothetical protein